VEKGSNHLVKGATSNTVGSSMDNSAQVAQLLTQLTNLLQPASSAGGLGPNFNQKICSHTQKRHVITSGLVKTLNLSQQKLQNYNQVQSHTQKSHYEKSNY
jgi:hypothetical protein